MCFPLSEDRILERGNHIGYEWVVTWGSVGFRCGYVRVGPGHPWHGQHYSDIQNVRVHGGLTFAEPDEPCGKGKEDDGYWVGFDCGHTYDSPDPTLPTYLPFLGSEEGICWTTPMVAIECQRLAQAAAAAESKR